MYTHRTARNAVLPFQKFRNIAAIIDLQTLTPNLLLPLGSAGCLYHCVLTDWYAGKFRNSEEYPSVTIASCYVYFVFSCVFVFSVLSFLQLLNRRLSFRLSDALLNNVVFSFLFSKTCSRLLLFHSSVYCNSQTLPILSGVVMILLLRSCRGADKSLARPERRQAIELGIYSTYSPRSSIHFLVCCSNFCKPLKKHSEDCPSNQVSAKAVING